MNIYLQWSGEEGGTWSSQVFVSSGYVPSLLAFPDNTVVLSYEDSGTCYLRESADSGSTWSAAFGSQTGTNPYIWGGLEDLIGRVFYNSGTGYVQYQVSYDRGATFATPVNVASPGGSVEPTGCFFADGTVAVKWNGTIYHNAVVDGSGSWT